jgi:hypothetical protein
MHKLCSSSSHLVYLLSLISFLLKKIKNKKIVLAVVVTTGSLHMLLQLTDPSVIGLMSFSLVPSVMAYN